MTIKEYATDVYLSVKGDVTYENLKRYIKRKGVQIVEYGSKTAKGNSILEALELTSYAERRNAFSFNNQEYDLIFIQEGLEDSIKLYLLAHEIGHKLTGHATTNGLVDENNAKAELEANEFQTLLLNPEYIQAAVPTQTTKSKSFRNKAYMACIVVVFTIALVSVAFAMHYHDDATLACVSSYVPAPVAITLRDEVDSTSPAAQTATSMQQEIPDDVQALLNEDFNRKVYVTATGEKYHKPDCQYLSNRKYYEITLKEAIERHLTGCKACKP